jgi:hypothetical protein
VHDDTSTPSPPLSTVTVLAPVVAAEETVTFTVIDDELFTVVEFTVIPVPGKVTCDPARKLLPPITRDCPVAPRPSAEGVTDVTECAANAVVAGKPRRRREPRVTAASARTRRLPISISPVVLESSAGACATPCAVF